MTTQIRGYVRLRAWSNRTKCYILADTFISHRYIPNEVALNPSASNTCGKTNYTYVSEVSFAS